MTAAQSDLGLRLSAFLVGNSGPSGTANNDEDAKESPLQRRGRQFTTILKQLCNLVRNQSDIEREDPISRVDALSTKPLNANDAAGPKDRCIFEIPTVIRCAIVMAVLYQSSQHCLKLKRSPAKWPTCASSSPFFLLHVVGRLRIMADSHVSRLLRAAAGDDSESPSIHIGV